MSLAAIIRAQLADGRPLRVTRALLEALDAHEDDVAGRSCMVCDRLTAERDEERVRANGWLAQKHDAERERDEAKRNARAWADERAQARLERDEARAEVERLRAALDVERSLECDASAVIRDAEERGARWAYSDFVGGSEYANVEMMAYRQREAERICAEARKAGEG